MIEFLPCIDSTQLAELRCNELSMPRHVAQSLGASAVVAIRSGRYTDDEGNVVDWAGDVASAISAKASIPPGMQLTEAETSHARTRIQVTNETTLGAAKRLVDAGQRPLALNFANGVQPGGGFLSGALAQEESLCRSSALFATLDGDPMYAAHRERPLPDSTPWAIYSPRVPVFRHDSGSTLRSPWKLSFVTCAAPVAHRLPPGLAETLMAERIERILAVARSYGYSHLILGAWGCGAFRNDPVKTAESFRDAIETRFSDAFSDIIFAVTDWSQDRRFLGPFRDVFR